MNDLIKEVHSSFTGLGDMPFDQALPKLRDELWRIANKYGTTGDEVLRQYLNWKSEQNNQN